MHRFAVPFILCALIKAPFPFPSTLAQDNAPKFRAGTNVVLVPVVATDNRGNHIPGFTAADLELKQDGKRTEIVSFEEITSEAAPAQAMTGSPRSFTNQVVAQHPKKLVIIVLDLLNTSFAGRIESRRGLIKVLSSLDPNTLSALVVFRGSSVSMIHNCTSDPAILIAAIKKLQAATSAEESPTLNIRGDVQSQQDAEAVELAAIIQGTAGDDAGNTSVAGALSVMRASQATMDLSFQHQAGLVTLENFQQLALYFGSVPGRKSLIWASSGFNFAMGSITGEATRGTTSKDWERTLRMLQDANIAVYPVDVSGLLTNSPRARDVYANVEPGGSIAGRSAILQSIEAGVFNDPATAKHATMRTVAERTGGTAFYNLNDSNDLFRRAISDSTQYYMLTFAAKDINKEGWHKIEVKPKRDGTQVRYRTGFFVTKDIRNPEITHQTDELLATTSALNFTMLPVNGEWQRVEPAGDKRKVHFTLNLPPGVPTIDKEHENKISLDFLAVAHNADGQNIAQVRQSLERKLPPAGVAQIEGSGLTYVNSLTLPPGDYRVAIVVRDNLTGRIGSVVSRLKVD
jgi:VWFA-related protein